MSEFTPILNEKQLSHHSFASIDAQGRLCIIQDDQKPEDEQVYVFLCPQSVRALQRFLRRKEVMEVYNKQ